MATTDVVPREPAGGVNQKRIVNDLSIQVATVNGSGSQSSNTVLLRTIFQMGVPVSGKNLFPSNIAGLPTWYTIRANKNGYIAPQEGNRLPGRDESRDGERRCACRSPPALSVLYDEPLALHKLRDDLTFYSVPYDKIVAQVCPEAKLRKLVKNMVYVGRGREPAHLDMAEVEKAHPQAICQKG